MAQPINCDNQDGQPAALIISNVSNGETVALCATCLPEWALNLAEALMLERTREGAEPAVGEPAPGEEAGPAGMPESMPPDEEEPAELVGGEEHPIAAEPEPQPAPDPVGDAGVESGQ